MSTAHDEGEGGASNAYALNCPEQFKDSILNLLWWAETEKQKHSLSHEYFEARWFWWLSLPVSLIAFISGLLSFLASSASLEDSTETRNIMTLVAGSLGIFATFYNALQASLKWDASSQMHKSATMQLDGLTCRLWELGSLKEEDTTSTDIESNIESLSNAITKINDSCMADDSYKIREAFAMMERQMNLVVNRRTTSSVADYPTVMVDYPTNTELYIAAVTELAAVISDHKVKLCGCPLPWGFPFFLPSPRTAVNEAIEFLDLKKEQTTTDESRNLLPS